MLEKIKKVEYRKNLDQLRDVRTLGLIIFVVIVLMVSWSAVHIIQLNYNLQKQISALQQQNDVQKLLNENLKLQNQYFETDQYLELQARRQLGRAAPGETIVLVPKSVALKHSVEVAKVKQEKPVADEPQKSNFQAWIDFLFRRSVN